MAVTLWIATDGVKSILSDPYPDRVTPFHDLFGGDLGSSVGKTGSM